MERVYLPDDHCDGYDAPSGRRYTAQPGAGYVDMFPEDAARVRARTGLKVGRRWYAPLVDSKVCTACGRSQLAALAGQQCTWCGGDWDETSVPPLPPVHAQSEFDNETEALEEPETGRRVKVYDI